MFWLSERDEACVKECHENDSDTIWKWNCRVMMCVQNPINELYRVYYWGQTF
jgi:hypothetical protein